MARIVTRGSLFGRFGLLGLALVACSTDDDLAGPPHGPKDFAIASVATVETVQECGGLLTLDCTEPLLVSILPAIDPLTSKLGDFLLAPPGGCGDETNCGWLVVTPTWSATDADPPTAVALEPTTDSVRAIRSPVVIDLRRDLRQPGDLTLTVTLQDYEDQPVKADSGKPLSADCKVELNTTKSCVLLPSP